MMIENLGATASVTAAVPATRIAQSAAQTGTAPIQPFRRLVHGESAASSVGDRIHRREESSARLLPVAPPMAEVHPALPPPPESRRTKRIPANRASRPRSAHERSNSQGAPAVLPR